MSRRAAGLAVAVMMAGALVVSAAEPGPESSQRRRGQYLRTDVVRTETVAAFTCALAPVAGSYPQLILRRQERTVVHEVRVYEVVTEDLIVDPETGRQSIRHRVSAGDEMRGESTTRETARDLGPFADEPFLIQEQPVRTDPSGVYIDREQRLLSRFDDLSLNQIDIDVRHADLGRVTLRVSRYLTLRREGQRPDERQRLLQADLLVALGADYGPQRASGREGLVLEAVAPDQVHPGVPALVRVRASNRGPRAVSCLTGRLFSRQDWITGMNFYLGNLAPGESREFERLVVPPADAPPGSLYAALGFWDILGPLPTQARALRTRVAPTAEAPIPAPETAP